MQQQEPFKSSAVIPLAPKSIHDSATYTNAVYHHLHVIGLCMDFDPKQLHKLPWRLYTQLAKQGFKQRGRYEIQLPHLVKIRPDDGKPGERPPDFFFSPCLDDSVPDAVYTSTLIVDPKTRLRPGVYVCSLDLNLSNPHWRLEDIEMNPETLQWDLDEVFKRIPPNQPMDCEATFTVNVLRYTGPLPDRRVSSNPIGSFFASWIPTEQLQRIRGEFNRYFLESG